MEWAWHTHCGILVYTVVGLSIVTLQSESLNTTFIHFDKPELPKVGHDNTQLSFKLN